MTNHFYLDKEITNSNMKYPNVSLVLCSIIKNSISLTDNCSDDSEYISEVSSSLMPCSIGHFVNLYLVLQCMESVVSLIPFSFLHQCGTALQITHFQLRTNVIDMF